MPDTEQGPDLSLGIAVSDIPASGMLRGHIGDDGVLLARVGSEYFAIGASCTHYGGPLADGVLDGHTVRCPWHHACFSLRTGEALRAPALDPVASWTVEQRGEAVFVTGKTKALPTRKPLSGKLPSRIVIVGGGAAGFAAAEQLRRHGYEGTLVMLSDDADPPVDRPNLSKDYLAGAAQEEWVPLRPRDWYRENAIELRLDTKVAKIDPRAREIEIEDGKRLPYDRLLLATGAEPIRLAIPGADLPHVHVLRTLKNCRAIIAAAGRARR
ncbi:MAG: FAD-dependent oxidoreductase, partial [Xanthobacteraceae bacterium]